MKILYDYPSLSQIHGGVSRYICGIIKEMNRDIKIDMSILYTDNIYLEDLPFLNIRHILKGKDFKGKIKIEKILNTFYSNYKIIRNNYDVFHANYSDPYFLFQPKRPMVVTIHDMINEKVPDYRTSHAKQIESKKSLIYSATQIITVSENTKKDLLEIYPINPEKISVIYHGAPTGITKVLKNHFGKYILYVGRRTRYKNFRFFVQSIASLLTADTALKMVCVGAPFNQEEDDFLKELDIRRQVFACSASEDELYSLYRNAIVFVYPSTFEGFGIPILEAFANNCPVCLSYSSCFPEIAGDAALYFDPEDQNSIFENVQRIITDRTLSSEFVKRGEKRLSTFSWNKAAQQTLEVYQKSV